MAGQNSQDLVTATVNSFAQRVQDYAAGIANRLGEPLSGQQLSRDEAVQRWNFSPLGSTIAADAQYHALVASGMPPGQALSQVYPMRQLLIQGSDLNDSIQRAQQIAGWAANAAGTAAPAPYPHSTILHAIDQQNLQKMGAGPASPALAGLPAPSGPAPASPLSLPVPPPPPAPSLPANLSEQPSALTPPPVS